MQYDAMLRECCSLLCSSALVVLREVDDWALQVEMYMIFKDLIN